MYVLQQPTGKQEHKNKKKHIIVFARELCLSPKAQTMQQKQLNNLTGFLFQTFSLRPNLKEIRENSGKVQNFSDNFLKQINSKSSEIRYQLKTLSCSIMPTKKPFGSLIGLTKSLDYKKQKIYNKWSLILIICK